MYSHDFGPIPVSRLKADAPQIFEALGQGRRVLVSRRGEVVAAIDPPDAIDTQVLAEYALPGRRNLDELSASEINRGSPSRAVADAAKGLARYVTKDSRVYGMLRRVTGEELAAELPTPQEATDHRQRVEELLQVNPAATAEEIVALTQDGGVSAPGDAPDLAGATETSNRFRHEVRSLAGTVRTLQLLADAGVAPMSDNGVGPPHVGMADDLARTASAAAQQAAALARSAATVQHGR